MRDARAPAAGHSTHFNPRHWCLCHMGLYEFEFGAAGNGLGATAKYLRRTTSGAAGNGLGNKIKYLRRTTSGAAGSNLDARPSTCDAQRATPRATALALRSSTCEAQRAAPRASAWAPRPSTCDHNERRRELRPEHQVQVLAKIAIGASGNGLGATFKYYDAKQAAPRATDWASRPSTRDAQLLLATA
jgi:hypothetical protein